MTEISRSRCNCVSNSLSRSPCSPDPADNSASFVSAASSARSKLFCFACATTPFSFSISSCCASSVSRIVRCSLAYTSNRACSFPTSTSRTLCTIVTHLRNARVFLRRNTICTIVRIVRTATLCALRVNASLLASKLRRSSSLARWRVEALFELVMKSRSLDNKDCSLSSRCLSLMFSSFSNSSSAASCKTLPASLFCCREDRSPARLAGTV
mmetsp:Transcript_6689/g.11177  ORF Transcript_6689/g.11177 Transcript_6689/m.11177 type:complete len:212 (+) Transcript_6689:911-1546(+)